MKRLLSLLSLSMMFAALLGPTSISLYAQEAISEASGILQLEFPNEELRQAANEPVQKISAVYEAVVAMNKTALKNLETYQAAVDELAKNNARLNRAKADQALANYYVVFLQDAKSVIQSGSEALSFRANVHEIFEKAETMYLRLDESYKQDLEEDKQQSEQIRRVVQDLIRPYLDSLRQGKPLPPEIQDLIGRLHRENPFLDDLLHRSEDSREQTAKTVAQCQEIFKYIDQRFDDLDADLIQVRNNLAAVGRVVKNHAREIALVEHAEELNDILEAFGQNTRPDPLMLPSPPRRNAGTITHPSPRFRSLQDDIQWALEIAGFAQSATSIVSQ